MSALGSSVAAATGSPGGVSGQTPAELPASWPNRELSQRLITGRVDWHYQAAGQGTPLLLLHGTGASTHSWRGLLPRLGQHFRVIAPDLPGHGYSHVTDHACLSLDGMAKELAGLLQALDFQPRMLVGHSAGAAIAMRLVLDGKVDQAEKVVGLNPALLPFGGDLARALQPLTRVVAGLPGLPTLVAARARGPGSVERLIRSTGSRLDAAGIRAYRQVLSRPEHVAATLSMMARWRLEGLLHEWRMAGEERELPALHVLVGAGDRTVPPDQGRQVAGQLPGCGLQEIPGLGHLMHEESPDQLAAMIVQFDGVVT